MYWGQLPFYNLQSLEKVLGTGGRGMEKKDIFLRGGKFGKLSLNFA